MVRESFRMRGSSRFSRTSPHAADSASASACNIDPSVLKHECVLHVQEHAKQHIHRFCRHCRRHVFHKLTCWVSHKSSMRCSPRALLCRRPLMACNSDAHLDGLQAGVELVAEAHRLNPLLHLHRTQVTIKGDCRVKMQVFVLAVYRHLQRVMEERHTLGMAIIASMNCSELPSWLALPLKPASSCRSSCTTAR